MHRIIWLVWHRKPEVHPILSPDIISGNWTQPFLHCKLLWMALREYLVALVRTTMSEAWRLQEVKGKFLTSGRLLKHCLLQFKAYLTVLNPLRGQLVPGQRKQYLIKGNKKDLMILWLISANWCFQKKNCLWTLFLTKCSECDLYCICKRTAVLLYCSVHHSPNLPYSKGIGSHAAAIRFLKVV